MKTIIMKPVNYHQMNTESRNLMWKYQKRIHMMVEKALIQTLEVANAVLSAKVFFLGFADTTKTTQQPYTVCIEPEWLDPYSNLFDFLQNTNQVTPEIILTTFQQCESTSHLTYFVSQPISVEGYKVFIVIETDFQATKINPNLFLSIPKSEAYLKPISLLHCLFAVFLEECELILKDPHNYLSQISEQEVLRKAAIRFMLTVSRADINIVTLFDLFDCFNRVSSIKYENQDGKGKIVIAKKKHPKIKLLLELEQPIDLIDFRRVRKLLQLSTESNYLISDGENILGIGKIDSSYHHSEENIFVIDFVSHYKWMLLNYDQPLMIVDHYRPALPKEKIDYYRFHTDMKRIFKNITKEKLKRLWKITIQATKQNHGCTLVISEKAEAEAKRLMNQSFTVKPFCLNEQIIHQLTSIDGAVIMDPDGMCYGIGVILDGVANPKVGDSSRGARYNSALLYYHANKQTPLVIFVISEDGMVDMIPTLKPKIRHSEITQNIEAFSALK
ncbi:MAG: hypothetical protein NZ108_03230, partial [Bacteroidia bacterium]|nr:hypothetical protein [Bacteroidia bacterium]